MDKKINVKITANTSKFKKAISDATKSLNNMKKSSDKISKSKIDKNLNKQFDNITKGSKKVDKQLQQNIKSLKDIAKSKLDKVVKQFDNMNKTVKNNNKTLQSLQKTLNSLKTKSIEAVNKALTSMSKGASTVSKSLSNVKNVLSSISTKTIEALTRSITTLNNKCPAVASGFTKIKDAINKISTKTIETVRASLDKIKDKCPAVSNGFTNIKNNINNIKSGVFSTLSSKLDAVKSKASDTGNKFKDLKSRISDTAKQTFQKLVDSTTRLNTEGTKSGNIFTNFGNKIKSLTGSALGGLSNKLNSLKGTTVSLNSSFAGTATKAVVAGTAIASSSKAVTTMANSNKQLATALGSSQKEVNKLGTAFNKLKLGTLNEKLPEVRSNILDLSNKVKKAAENYAKYTQQLSRAEEAMSKQRVLTDRQVEGLERLRKKQKDAENELRNWEALLNSERDVESMLNAERDKAIQKIGKYSNAEKTATKSTKDNTKALNDAAKAEDKLNSSTIKVNGSMKTLVSGTKTLKSATGNLRQELGMTEKKAKTFGDRFKDLGSKLESFSTKIGKVIDKIKGDVIGKLNKGDFSGAFSGLKDAGKALFSAVPGWAKAIIVLGAALKKLYDLGKQRFFEGLNNIKNVLQPIVDFTKNLGSQIKTTFETITNFRLNLSGLVQAGVNFESQMNKVGNISGANANQLEKLSDKAKLLGSTTRYQAYQIGQAYEYMGMAGWNAAEMLDGINAVIDLSILSSTDLGTASDIVTDDLTAMGLQANQASDFVDKLAATITRSNTTVELYGESMKQCGAQAGTLGVSVTDLNTSIGLMANAGIKGSKAGMSMKNMLANMAAPTEKMEKALKQLGLTADESGSYLKTTAEGNVDLEATVKSLMQALKKKNKVEQMSLVTAIAGKNAAPGIIALLSQGEEAWDELSDQIENSTQKVQYWNENMHIMGKKGDEARKIIEKFKDVFSEVEEEATAMGMSTEDLALSIQVLGSDGKVTAENMRDLMKVFESMNSTSDKTQKKWRDLSKGIKDSNSKVVKAVKTGFDYDTTVANIRSDTSGLTQAQKEQIISQLKTNMTYEEANKILKEHGLEAERVTLASMSYADKLEYLRETLKGCSDEQIKSKLETLGLGEAYDEVREIVKMSDKEWKQYKKNQETIKSLSEQMAKAMDEDTKGALLGLASAIEGKAIQVFEKLKDKIKGASDALATFFAAWKENDFKTALLGGYKDEDGNVDIGLVKKVQAEAKKIPKVIQDAIASAKNFITGGSLQGILDMGTSIITGICQGIINSKEDLTTAISEGIKQICDWIHKNKDQVKEAGLTILQAIGDGIKENRTEIETACNDIYEIINAWTATHQEAMTNLGMTLGGPFIVGFAKGVQQEIQASIRGIGDSIVAEVKAWPQKIKEGFSNLSFADFLKSFSKNAYSGGQNIGMQITNGIMKGLGIPNIVDIIGNFVRNIIDWFKEKFGIHSPSTVMADEVGQYVILGIAQGILDHIGDFFSKVGELKDKVVNFFKDLFGFGKDKENPMNNLDASKAKELDKALQSLTKTAKTCKEEVSTAFSDLRDSLKTSFVSCASIARNQFVNIANIARNQMVNVANIVRNQMLNCTNITRNQFVNMSNIIKNQSTNARNAATSQFISLKKVISTQLSEARQLVASKMISIANVVNTQSSNARNNATRHFISLRKVIQTQMSAAYSSVSSYMGKIASATNRTLHTKVNVTKSVKTVDAGKSSSLAALSASAFNSLNAMALSGSGLTYATAAGTSSGVGISGAYNGNSNNVLYFELPTYLDGKVVAKTTAKYMNNELTILDKKNSRKRGNK